MLLWSCSSPISSEVNGVRFPAGVVIDVKREDGEKLIEAKKAEFISTEESRLFKSQEGLDDSQTEDSIKEQSAEAEVSDDVPEAVSDEQGAEAEVSDDVPEAVSDEQSAEAEVSDDVPEAVSDEQGAEAEVSDDVPEAVSDEKKGEANS